MLCPNLKDLRVTLVNQPTPEVWAALASVRGLRSLSLDASPLGSWVYMDEKGVSLLLKSALKLREVILRCLGFKLTPEELIDQFVDYSALYPKRSVVLSIKFPHKKSLIEWNPRRAPKVFNYIYNMYSNNLRVLYNTYSF
jgi:hypothetical protein